MFFGNAACSSVSISSVHGNQPVPSTALISFHNSQAKAAGSSPIRSASQCSFFLLNWSRDLGDWKNSVIVFAGPPRST